MTFKLFLAFEGIMIKIKVIMSLASNVNNEITCLSLQKLNLIDVEYDIVNLKNGPSTFVNGRIDVSLITPELIELFKSAENEGFHGIYVSCYYDPGIEAIREAVKIPVMAPMMASLATAQLVAQKYGVLAVVEQSKSIFISLIRSLNLESNVSGIYVVDINPQDLKEKPIFISALEKCCLQAKQEGAQAMILGCTATITPDVTKALSNNLKNRGIFFPLIDGTDASIMQLYALCKQSLCHSGLAYHT